MNNIVRVTDYFEAPPRIAVSGMIVTDQQRYAATGKIVCQGLAGTSYSNYETVGSAQLTVRRDIITTASGAILDHEKGNCATKSRAEACVFIIRSHGADRNVRVAKLVDKGVSCEKPYDPADNWAVMKLSEPVDDIIPYPVNFQAVANVRLGIPIVTVASSIDFQSPSQGMPGSKHYSLCSVLKTYPNDGIPRGISSACGCAIGCGGGSLLTPGASPSLLGVFVQSSDSEDDTAAAQRRGRPNMVHWQADGNGSYYALITGKFSDALQKALDDR